DCNCVPHAAATLRTAHDAGDATSANPTWNANCNCVGQPLDCNGTPGGSALPGTSCDDGNPATINDVLNADCECVGTPVPLDCNEIGRASSRQRGEIAGGDVNTDNKRRKTR